VRAVHSSIAPGGSVTVTVTFEPTKLGTFSDEIGLVTTGGSKEVGLTGSAGLPGALAITSEATDYGNVNVGTSRTKAFTITNTGGTSVAIMKSKPPLGGAFAAATSLPEGTTIEPGGSVTEQVTFTPTAPGPATGTWQITGNDTTGPHVVSFSGVGIVTPPVETSTPLLAQGPGPSLAQGVLAVQEVKMPVPDAELTSAELTASRAGTVRAVVSCPVDEISCTGRVTLRTLTPTLVTVAGNHGLNRKLATLALASGSFVVPGGRLAAVSLHLTVAGRALLARHRVLRTRATIPARDLAGATHVTRTLVTLRLAKVSSARPR
jgi:hypothetical protein